MVNTQDDIYSMLKRYALVAAATYPTWSVFLYWAHENEYDSPYGRALIGFIFLMLYIVEEKYELFKENFDKALYTMYFVLTLQFYWLCYKSNFSNIYVIGVFIIASVTTFLLLDRVLNIIYSAMSISLAIGIGYITHLNWSSHSMLVVGMITIHFVSVFVLEEHTRIREDLKKLQAENINTAKMSLIGQVTSGIAHEVNNPLAILQSNVFKMNHALKKGRLTDEKIKDHLDRMDDVITRTSEITKGMLKLSRKDNDEIVHVFDITKIVSDSMPFVSKKLENHSIDLIHHKPGHEIFITCNEVQMSQVFLNLISNAIDAIKNLENKSIEVGYIEYSDSVEIYFMDSGKGIPKKLRDSIMNPFFTTKEIGEGTGLGLSISQNIIKRHNGALQICPDSENTKFIIKLPTVAKEAKLAA